jgi:hypothetical protein
MLLTIRPLFVYALCEARRPHSLPTGPSIQILSVCPGILELRDVTRSYSGL